MNLSAYISTFLVVGGASIATSAYAGGPSNVADWLNPIVDLQLVQPENKCSRNQLVAEMNVDLERYANYSGVVMSEYVSTVESSKDVLFMLIAIESDFEEHSARLPISEMCNVNYRRLIESYGK